MLLLPSSPHTPQPQQQPATPRQAKPSTPATPFGTAVTSQSLQQPYTPRQPEPSTPATPFDTAFTTIPTSSPSSLGDETTVFRRRKAREGDTFAFELYRAIRNDHFMRQCHCGMPNIYNSQEEAEQGAGHLRFYVVDENKHNLRVLQRKTDMRWHCHCESQELHPVYQEHIAKGRKRRADVSEFDLILQSEENSNAKSVERVISAPELNPSEETRGETAQPTTMRRPMWSYISETVSTMGTSVISLFGNFLGLVGSRHEAVQTVQEDPKTNQVVIKRFKRVHARPHTRATTEAVAEIPGEAPHVEFVQDPAAYIGHKVLAELHTKLLKHLTLLREKKYLKGFTWSELNNYFEHESPTGLDKCLSTILCAIVYLEYGGIGEKESLHDCEKKTEKAAAEYEMFALQCIRFLESMYLDQREFDTFREKYKNVPPMPFAFGNLESRAIAGNTARLFAFILRNRELIGIDEAQAVALAKIVADAKAVHKQECPLSWTVFTGVNRWGTELEYPSVFEEVPIEEFVVEPAHEAKLAELGSSDPELQADPKADKMLRKRPKSALMRRRRDWPTPILPEHYVPTPERNNKAAFPPQTIKSGEPPRNSPVTMKELTLFDIVTLEDPICNTEAMRKAEDKFHMQYYNTKYGSFMDDLRHDVEAQVAAVRPDRPEDDKEKPEARIFTAEEIKNFRRSKKETARKRDEKMRMLRELKKPWSTSLKKLPRATSPSVWKPSLKPDTPESIRKYFDERRRRPGVRPHTFRGFGQRPPKCPLPPLSAADRRRMMDRAFGGPGSIDQSDEPPPNPFADEPEDLEIAVMKREALDLTRQIVCDFTDAIKLSMKERRQREAEEARLKKEEEARRRAEEEKRRKAEEMRKAKAEAARENGLRRPFASLITDLNKRWDDLVFHAQYAEEPNKELARTPPGTPLTQRDFNMLLPETAWLNDNVIEGSIFHIANYVNEKAGITDKKNPKCAAVTSFFYNRLLSHGAASCSRAERVAGISRDNFFNIETILIPICSGNHWTLAVVRPQRRTVSHLDSMLAGHGHHKVKKNILEWVKVVLGEKFVEADWKLVDLDAPRQNNGYDCGVFTITNGICLALGLNPIETYRPEQLTLQRKRLAAVLLNGGFKGEFSLELI